MALRRRRKVDPLKELYWRRILDQWRRSGQSIRAFCRQQRLSEPLFYAWRRTIAQRDQARQPSGHRCLPQDIASPTDEQKPEAPPAFVPLHVLPATATLEVVLHPGCLVRVPTGFDPATLRQLLVVLHESPSC